MKAVILAGGTGERFWPLSTPDKPKQFLNLFGNKSLIRQTFERLATFLKPQDIFIVTLEKFVQKIHEEIPEIPYQNIISEPMKRNTAPACLLGALYIGLGETIVTLPADHFIPDKKKFWKTLEKAAEGVEKYRRLFTIGIKPTRPETGYGYIEIEREIEDGIFSVKKFREKPDYETAMEFVEKGTFYWNSGIFVWKGIDLVEEMKKHAKKIYEKLANVDVRNIKELRKVYENIEGVSIDYAVLEKSCNIMMVKGEFEWSDIGNWVSVREIEGYSIEKDNLILVDSEKVFVKGVKKRIAIVGLEDVIVVEGDEGILILKESHVHEVRKVVKKIYGDD